MGLPLGGVRVVEVTTVIAGPYSTLLLADLGAEVIHVEGPSGDVSRRVGPAANPEMGANHLTVNRGKRSVVLDLTTPEGRAGLKSLTDTADVFVHNLRPETVKRLGADSDTLRAGHPELIHCGIRGYGAGGRYQNLPAYDDVIQAQSGIAGLQEWMTGRPQYVANALADKVTGLMAALAVAAGLHQQALKGEGCVIEIPMFETITAFTLLEHMWGRTFIPPRGDARYPRQASPGRRPYQTADGWIAILVYTDRHWARFADLIGRPELATDARYKDVAARNRNVDTIFAIFDESLRAHTTDEWIRDLTEAGIPCARYNRLEGVFDDPHLIEVDFFQTLEHPTEGNLLQYVTPFLFNGQRPDLGMPARRLGEDTGGAWKKPS
jgi:crotonobetainyl-CoA:carnitine CoA-transferase CaiB-like acyl-CoA transferase